MAKRKGLSLKIRKSIRIGKNVRLNISKSGIGMSAGVKGFRVGTGPRGGKVTASIPGSGISLSQSFRSARKATSRKRPISKNQGMPRLKQSSKIDTQNLETHAFARDPIQSFEVGIQKFQETAYGHIKNLYPDLPGLLPFGWGAFFLGLLIWISANSDKIVTIFDWIGPIAVLYGVYAVYTNRQRVKANRAEALLRLNEDFSELKTSISLDKQISEDIKRDFENTDTLDYFKAIDLEDKLILSKSEGALMLAHNAYLCEEIDGSYANKYAGTLIVTNKKIYFQTSDGTTAYDLKHLARSEVLLESLLSLDFTSRKNRLYFWIPGTAFQAQSACLCVAKLLKA